MKITDIRFERLNGQLSTELPLFEGRVLRPIDVYPEHRAEGSEVMSAGRFAPTSGSGDEAKWQISGTFIFVDTDEGITGIAGPGHAGEANFIKTQLRDLLIGENPLATERVWDKMYRYLIHGRKGEPMFAVSLVDCALWDIRGKYSSMPLYKMLGGPTRKSFPAYASALGFPINPEQAAAQAKKFVSDGYTATKWFVRDGPMDGEIGKHRNVELIAAIREAVGPNVEIMIDAWNSWDVRYTLDMAKRLEEYRPRWLEEVVKPDDISGYARVRQASPIPISGGEHEYTRWGAREYFERGAVDVYQADTLWAGGISEMIKIAALASAFEIELIPHGASVPINAAITAAQSPPTSPYIEYLVQWNEMSQFFFKDPIKPIDGMVTVGELPGLGLEIDENKVESRKSL